MTHSSNSPLGPIHRVLRTIPLASALVSLPIAIQLQGGIAKLFRDLYPTVLPDLSGEQFPALSRLLILGSPNGAAKIGITVTLLLTFGITLFLLRRLPTEAARATAQMWLMAITFTSSLLIIGSTLIAGQMPLLLGPIQATPLSN